MVGYRDMARWWSVWRCRRILQSEGIHEEEARLGLQGPSAAVVLPSVGRPTLRVCVRLARDASRLEPPWELRPATLTVSRGPQAKALAWVGHDLYSVARLGDRCWVEGQDFGFETVHLNRSRAEVARLMARLATAAHNLEHRPPIDDTLRHHARRAREGAVRLRASRLLLERAPDRQARRRTAIRALVDEDPRVRLAGALEVGWLGRSTLEALVLDEALSLEDRRRALAFFVQRFGEPSLIPILVNMACELPPELAVDALEALPVIADDRRAWVPAVIRRIRQIGRRDGRPGETARRILTHLSVTGADGRGALSVVQRGELSEKPDRLVTSSDRVNLWPARRQ